MSRTRFAWLAGCIAVLPLPLAAESPAPAAVASHSDTSAIKWFVPGQFEKARKAAKASKRLLVLKGIAFGLDRAGAQSATAGCW